MKHLIVFSIVSLFALVGCKPAESNSQEQAEQEQENVIKSARAKIPTYQPSNFLTRQTVNKWMKRMDTPSKTFYVYLLGDNGNHIGYYVAQTRPISSCTLMTPPKRLERGAGGGGYSADFVMPAPSLDGVYGGGGCDSAFFFFDATTDAYVEIQGMDFFVSDQPLNVDAKPINIKTE